MRLKNYLIVVKNIEKSKQFYHYNYMDDDLCELLESVVTEFL